MQRRNLVGTGVLPLHFKTGDPRQGQGRKGNAVPDLQPAEEIRPPADALLRIDTPVEVDHCRHGGIPPFVLRQPRPA